MDHSTPRLKPWDLEVFDWYKVDTLWDKNLKDSWSFRIACLCDFHARSLSDFFMSLYNSIELYIERVYSKDESELKYE